MQKPPSREPPAALATTPASTPVSTLARTSATTPAAVPTAEPAAAPSASRPAAARRAGREPWLLLGLVLLAHGFVLGPALEHAALGGNASGPERALPKAMETRQILLPGAAPALAAATATPPAVATAPPSRAPRPRSAQPALAKSGDRGNERGNERANDQANGRADDRADDQANGRAADRADDPAARTADAERSASKLSAQDADSAARADAAASAAASTASAPLPNAAFATADAPPPGQASDAATATAAAAQPTATSADSAPVPTYATQIAAAFQLSYELRRGVLTGTGELRFKREGDAYELSLDGRVLGVEAISLASKGSLDAHGLAPERFTDRRRGRDRQAANFDRAGGRITYSGPSTHHNLAPGSQDRLSWMVQLPAVIEARPAQWLPGARIQLFVTGARGDADIWTFNVHERAALEWQGQVLPDVLRLTREPRKPYDTQVEVWLDPARLHLPVRARLTSLPGGDTLELELAPSAR